MLRRLGINVRSFQPKPRKVTTLFAGVSRAAFANSVARFTTVTGKADTNDKKKAEVKAAGDFKITSQPISLSSVPYTAFHCAANAWRVPSILNIPWPKEILGVNSDMGGTAFLKYCRQPAQAFLAMLVYFGVVDIESLVEKILAPMGMKKELHVEFIRNIAEIKQQLDAKTPSPTLKEMYGCYLQKQDELLEKDSDIIPGAQEWTQYLIKNNVSFSYSSGFPRSTLQLLIKNLTGKIPLPKVIIAADDKEAGKGSRAEMVALAMKKAGVPEELQHLYVFITDALEDLRSVRARFPHMIIIAVTDYGTALGIVDPRKVEHGSKEFLERRVAATEKFKKEGATIIVNNLTEIPQAVHNYMLARRLEQQHASQVKMKL